MPFLLRWKGRLRGGRTFDDPVISLDVAATALGVAGLDVPEEIDGVDLLPHLDGATARAPHGALCWRYGDQAAVRAGEWKLVMRAGREELFHLGRDAGEGQDLLAQEPERARALRAEYAKWERGVVAPLWPERE